jgi:peroxiredoxin Q/BCP
MAKLNIGDKAPDFQLPDAEEKLHSLADYNGNWVVLYFYPKDNTPGCTTEAKDFTSAAEEFGKLGAVIIGISPDKPASHVKFIQKHDLNLLLLSDVEHTVLEQYDAWRLKKLYGREFMGVIRSTFLISPNGEIVRIWPKVKVKGHVEEVLKTLKEKVSG